MLFFKVLSDAEIVPQVFVEGPCSSTYPSAAHHERGQERPQSIIPTIINQQGFNSHCSVFPTKSCQPPRQPGCWGCLGLSEHVGKTKPDCCIPTCFIPKKCFMCFHVLCFIPKNIPKNAVPFLPKNSLCEQWVQPRDFSPDAWQGRTVNLLAMDGGAPVR